LTILNNLRFKERIKVIDNEEERKEEKREKIKHKGAVFLRVKE
jgi:hypothetical protein